MGAEQLLKIEPDNELKFKGPFTTATTAFLKLSNPTSRRICFKIKTTAPKRYCVRPNSGIIEAGGHLNIAVVLQPCEVDSSASKHKFMVQSILAPDGDLNQDDLWKSTASSQVMETKLRCTFEIPPSETSNNHDYIPLAEEKMIRSVHKLEFEASTKPPQLTADEFDSDERNRQVKSENVQLKEEIERLRRKLKRAEGGDAMQLQSAIPPPSQSMLFVVISIIVLMIGLLVGKFAL